MQPPTSVLVVRSKISIANGDEPDVRVVVACRTVALPVASVVALADRSTSYADGVVATDGSVAALGCSGSHDPSRLGPAPPTSGHCW